MHIQCIEERSSWNFPQASGRGICTVHSKSKTSNPHNPPTNISLDTGTLAGPQDFFLLIDSYLVVSLVFCQGVVMQKDEKDLTAALSLNINKEEIHSKEDHRRNTWQRNNT